MEVRNRRRTGSPPVNQGGGGSMQRATYPTETIPRYQRDVVKGGHEAEWGVETEGCEGCLQGIILNTLSSLLSSSLSSVEQLR